MCVHVVLDLIVLNSFLPFAQKASILKKIFFLICSNRVDALNRHQLTFKGENAPRLRLL